MIRKRALIAELMAQSKSLVWYSSIVIQRSVVFIVLKSLGELKTLGLGLKGMLGSIGLVNFGLNRWLV